MSTDTTPQTKRQAYRRIVNSGDDVALRKQVAASIAIEPATTAELAKRFDHSANAIRPRVNELLRMSCVERDGTHVNDSGHEAYAHHITERGRRYLAGECNPEPKPPLSSLKNDVVDVARAVVAGDADEDALRDTVQQHDDVKQRRNPDWTPPHTVGLTQEEIAQIKADPTLELSDFDHAE